MGLWFLWEEGWEAMPQGEGVDHSSRTGPGRSEYEVLGNYASSEEKW